jgi:hypothetical protein
LKFHDFIQPSGSCSSVVLWRVIRPRVRTLVQSQEAQARRLLDIFMPHWQSIQPSNPTNFASGLHQVRLRFWIISLSHFGELITHRLFFSYLCLH